MSLQDSLTGVIIESTIFKNARAPTPLVNALKAFERILARTSEANRMQFKIKNDAALRSVKSAVKSSHIPALQSLHDRVFVNLLMFNSTKMLATEIFEEFIKSISLFKKDFSSAQPIYHREASCGPRSMDKMAYKNTRSCKLIHTKEELKRNKKLIMRCYLERLIYDSIFSHLTLMFPKHGDQESSQDSGHRLMLKDVRTDFETCYPNTTLEVSIKYNENNIPVMLAISQSSKRNQVLHERETYARIVNDQRDPTSYSEVYIGDTMCKKQVGPVTYYKTQNFESATDRWKKNPEDIHIYEALFRLYSSVVI